MLSRKNGLFFERQLSSLNNCRDFKPLSPVVLTFGIFQKSSEVNESAILGISGHRQNFLSYGIFVGPQSIFEIFVKILPLPKALPRVILPAIL